MKTLLESVNDLAGEYITMPLERFFLYITIILLVTLIVIALAAPLSSSKFMTMIVLYSTLIITALLTYGNYQINKIMDAEHVSEAILEHELATDEAFIA